MRTSFFRRVLGLSMALNVLAVVGSVALVQKKGGAPWVRRQVTKVLGAVEGKRVRSDYPNITLSVYEQLSIGPDDIILFGDDVLAYGGWHELLADPRVKNRAISYDDTRLLLARIRQIVRGGPRHVVMSCGSYNIQRRIPDAQTAAEYARIITLIMSGSPHTEIWLLPVLPVNKHLYQRWVAPDSPQGRRPARKDIEALNGVIRALAVNRPRVHFVDLPELVDPAGELRQEYTLNGLHLNGKGYRRIAMRLQQELPGDTGAALK
jgi:lysophospholipase L1-like esterase